VGGVVESGARSDISQHDPLSMRSSAGLGQHLSEQQQADGPCRQVASVAPGASARNKAAISRILVERAFKEVVSVNRKHTADFEHSARQAYNRV
jgi:hypothetical protein